MTLEQQVVSLDLAKKLKELGVKQESLFCWYKHKKDGWTLVWPWAKGYEYISAFTVAELGEILPDEVSTNKYTEPDLKTFMCKLHAEGDWQKYIEITEDSTEADARARMLIYLLENNLYDPTTN
jgi:hypothetical protein